MLKYLVVVSVLFWSLSAFAECSVNDDSFVIDIGQITSRVYSPEVMSGKFTQEKNIADMGITLKSGGSFSIDKSKGIKWKSEKPSLNTIIIEDNKICMDNGNGVTIIDSEVNQTMKHVVEVMRSLLTQDYEILQEHFDIYADICNGFHITLKSKDSTISSIFTKLDVYGSHFVEEVIFENKEGDKTKITFTDVTEKSEDFSCEQ